MTGTETWSTATGWLPRVVDDNDDTAPVATTPDDADEQHDKRCRQPPPPPPLFLFSLFLSLHSADFTAVRAGAERSNSWMLYSTTSLLFLENERTKEKEKQRIAKEKRERKGTVANPFLTTAFAEIFLRKHTAPASRAGIPSPPSAVAPRE